MDSAKTVPQDIRLRHGAYGAAREENHEQGKTPTGRAIAR